MFTLITWLRWCLQTSLDFKVTSFVINVGLCRGALRLCKYPITNQTSSLFTYFVSLWVPDFLFCALSDNQSIIVIIYFNAPVVQDFVSRNWQSWCLCPFGMSPSFEHFLGLSWISVSALELELAIFHGALFLFLNNPLFWNKLTGSCKNSIKSHVLSIYLTFPNGEFYVALVDSKIRKLINQVHFC